MSSALLRRTAVPVALVALTLAGAPLVGGSAAAATPPPAFQGGSSAPVPDGAVIVGDETITAAFDQSVTATGGSVVVYERNADGSRGFGLQGTAGSGSDPVNGCGKTITWKPAQKLVAGEYEVVINVYGTKSSSDCTPDKTRPATADYDYFVAGGTAAAKPSGITAPAVNNQNETAVPYTGSAPPDLTVTVTVSGKDVQTGQAPTTAKGSAKVPACGDARCTFTVKVDVSGLADGDLTSSAQGSESESSTKTDTAPGPTVHKDTTAPSRPTLSGSPTMTSDKVHVHVPSATSNSDAKHFIITIKDEDGHSTSQTVDAQTTMPAQDVPVSTLDDGTLTVLVQAADDSGNVSSPAQSDQLGDPYTVTKNAGLFPNLGASTLTTPAGDVTFVQAESQGVRTPTSIDVEFTQPVKLSYDNHNPCCTSASNPNGTQNASLQLTTPEGNLFLAVTPKLSSTGRGVTATIPQDRMPAAGSFGVSVTVFSQNLCPDVNPGQTDSCQKFSGQIRVGDNNTGDPFLITLDNKAPTINVTQADSPITASNLQTAGLAGTVDSDVTALQVTFTSSNAPGHPRVASLPTSTSNGTTSFSSSPLPLSGMVDGTLDVVLKATDAAGNVGQQQLSMVLNALGLTLTPGDGKLLVTWTKPTLVNGEAPTYTLTYRDQSVENAPIQSVSPASTATSQLLTGLVDGHDYGVTLTATDSVGGGPVAVGDAVPHGNPTLSLSAPKAVYGSYFTLRGRLADAGAGVAAKPVSVAMYYGSKKIKTFHTTTDGSGNLAVRVRPLHTPTFVASFAGDSGYAAATAKKRVPLHIKIGIAHLTTSGSLTRISGHVSPNMRGQVVYLYEIVKHKAHRLAHATVSSTSNYAFSRAFSRGKHVVFVRIYGHKGYYGNNSAHRSFTRS